LISARSKHTFAACVFVVCAGVLNGLSRFLTSDPAVQISPFAAVFGTTVDSGLKFLFLLTSRAINFPTVRPA
jgi:hypothetical protein